MLCVRKYRRELFSSPVEAIVICTDRGISVTVAGGELSHVGAVCIADGHEIVSSVTFPTHKETVIAEKWAQSIAEATGQETVVSAGIHYDDLSREAIGEVVALCEDMLTEILTDFRNA